jgi:hypothetical protein
LSIIKPTQKHKTKNKMVIIIIIIIIIVIIINLNEHEKTGLACFKALFWNLYGKPE